MDSKDELVKQHANVAEDALAGWERAENEVVELKQKLEDAASKNNVLEDRVTHLDGALKECVRQLRQFRDEQEDKIQEAVTRRSKELQSANTGLERRVLEINKEAEAAKSEYMVLRREFLAQREELEIVMVERDLSTQAAETASKQHLGSIKKVAKLEAECRKLRSLAKSSLSSLSSNQSSDSHSDGGREKLEGSCSDSWASSALISELYQFKSGDRSLHGTTLSTEVDLMDDFLEIERLVALPETQAKNCKTEYELNLVEKLEKLKAEKDELECEVNCGREAEKRLRLELEAVVGDKMELEDMLKKMEAEKAELKISYDVINDKYQESRFCFQEVEMKLEKLQAQKDELDNEVKCCREAEKSLSLELKDVVGDKMELEDRIKKMEAQKAELKTSYDDIRDKYQESGVCFQELEMKMEKLQEEKDELESEVKCCREAEKRLRLEFEAVVGDKIELEDKLEKMEAEKAELKISFEVIKDQYQESRVCFQEVEMKLEEIKRELKLANDTKTQAETQVIQMEAEVRKERIVSRELKEKCEKYEEKLRREIEEKTMIRREKVEPKIKQEDIETAAGKFEDCQKTIASLGKKLQSLATLEDFLIDIANIPDSARSVHKKEAFLSKDPPECIKTINRRPLEYLAIKNCNNTISPPPCASSSDSTTVSLIMSSNRGSSERNRTGFATVFTRSRNAIHLGS
ncbi:PREDICTED: filament-like plant protein 2 [Camelina sativa]|uniref:Filament-like plant protein 2 n=1 Tax=Camelina sativa TaxID=90675 RepID=A0ABM0WX45_CAMSA|nr:PREDICTED: filament-like plant protein 2 [Camelina sativa]